MQISDKKRDQKTAGIGEPLKTGTLDRYANCDGVFVLVCSGSLEANGVKKPIEIVYNLLIEPIQLSSFVVRELGVSPVRLK